MCLITFIRKCSKHFFTPIAILSMLAILLLFFCFFHKPSWEALSSLATLFVAITSFYTIQEMKKNREQELKPHLIILKPNETYTFKWIPSEYLQPITRPELRNSHPDQYGTRMPILRLKNIGNGPAKNIQITWTVLGKNIDEIISSSEILKKYTPEIKQGLFTISNTTAQNSSLSFANKMSTTFDYCISSPSNDFIEIIKMPSEIMANLEIQLIASSRPHQFKPIKLSEVELNLRYLDTNEEEYNQVFLIDPRLTYIPDNVGCSDIPIEAAHHSADNIRGHITFFVHETFTFNK